MEVFTDSDLTRDTRKVVLELLLSRSYEEPLIRELAARYGVTDTNLEKRSDKCIMCGLCVRVCHEIVGQSATCFVARGHEREVSTPYKELSDVCIGCGACALVCPTDAVDPRD